METSIRTDLFRFTTLRGPQLLTDDEKQRAFVFYDSTNYTPPLIPPGSPGTNSFSGSGNDGSGDNISSIAYLSSLYPDLYSFSKWLSANRRNHQFSYTYLQEKTAYLTLIDDQGYTLVWSSLFAVIAENGSKYLKEALIQLLVANQFIIKFRDWCGVASEGGNLADNYPYFYTTAHVKVVIPNEQVDAIRNVKSVSQQSTTVNEAAQAQNNRVEEVLSKLNSYQAAIDELLRADKQAALEAAIAHEAYTQAYQANLAAYVDGLEDVTDPETGITSKKIPNNPTARALQKFDFKPVDKLSGNNLEGKVSSNTLAVVNELNLYNFTSVTEAVQAIEARIQQLGNSFSATSLNRSTQVLVFNGTAWEASDRTLPMLPTDTLYGYQICSVYESCQQHFDIEINAGYTNPSVSSTIYHAHDSAGGSSTDGLFTVLSTSGYNIKIRLFPGNKLVKPSEDVYLVQGTITFSNGKSVTFENTLKGTVCTTGIAKLTGDGGAGTPEAAAESLIGIQQLGIADYRKVTQETCCYVRKIPPKRQQKAKPKT